MVHELMAAALCAVIVACGSSSGKEMEGEKVVVAACVGCENVKFWGECIVGGARRA